jgi:hypothetical protein
VTGDAVGSVRQTAEVEMQKAEYEARIAAIKLQYRYLFTGQHLGFDIAPGWVAIVEELCRHIDGALAAAEKRSCRGGGWNLRAA